MKVPPFATKLCVFSLLFYTALHVLAYKQTIIGCYLTILQKGQVTEFYSVDPLSHNIIIVLVYSIAKCSMNILGVYLYTVNISCNTVRNPQTSMHGDTYNI
jgi:hypothetical protein